jgi:hypothetical protein
MVQTQAPGLIDKEISAVWQQFIQTKVNSFIKWDLVRFFHDNPNTAETADNIAQFVGRDARTVHRELEGLVRSDVLLCESVSGEQIYRLTAELDMQKLIHDFVIACHNRDFRVKAINQVIHGMRYAGWHEF